MKSEDARRYINRAQELSIIPNFWLTVRYLSKIIEGELVINDKAIWIQDEEWTVFPPLPLQTDRLRPGDCPPLKIWSDFRNYSVGDQFEFLDWEYVYDSAKFWDMEGKPWRVFRKNCRKWPRKNESWKYNYSPPTLRELDRLLIKWLERRSTIEDGEALVQFLYHNDPYRRFLYRRGELVGVNTWDYNWPYAMYRYCIADPEEPFLDEFLRLCFYRNLVPGTLVIDGGSLGNPGLEKFKDKLNPIMKRPIYSKVLF